MRSLALFLAVGLAATPVVAQDVAEFQFGGDAYQAGRTVTIDTGVDSVFAAGENITLDADATGSVHMIGRVLNVTGAIAENFYGAGMDIDVLAPVSGDVTVMGYDISIAEAISGNLRATGTTVELAAPVAGSAIIAGETVEIGGVISGDLSLAAQYIDWDAGAQVLGNVDIYVDDPETITVPASVASADRVTLHESTNWDEGTDGAMADDARAARDHHHERSFGDYIRDFIGEIVIVGIFATILASLAPNWIAGLRGRTLADPARATWYGFLGLSALIGSIVGLIMTGIGIILVPFTLIAAVLLGALGYVVGAYVLGVWLLELAGRALPETTADRALAAFAGAAALAVIAIAPYLGWLVALAVAWAGAGSIVMGWFAIEVHDAKGEA